MVRTQIYLTAEEQNALDALAAATGTSKSALIREAIDRFLRSRSAADRLQLLRSARGMWSDRDSSDFDHLRQELDRIGA